MARDDATAVDWFRKAADQGLADAQTMLGIAYDTGKGVGQDDVAAASWYRKAADQGNVHAQSQLGLMYEKGRGVAQDYVAAASWYRKAAERGDPLAQCYARRLTGDLYVHSSTSVRCITRAMASRGTRASPPFGIERPPAKETRMHRRFRA